MCEFAEATANYHGKVVGRDEVCPVLAEVETIDKYPVTAAKKDLVQLPGLVWCITAVFTAIVHFGTVASFSVDQPLDEPHPLKKKKKK